MGFVEKIVGLMNGSSEPQAENSVEATEAEPQPTTEAVEQPEENQPPKTYTPEELESILADRKKEWLEEQDAKEQERLSKLPEMERLRQEQLSKDAKISSLQTELFQRDLKAKAISQLEAVGYPTGLADLLSYTDQDSMEKSLAHVKTIFQNSVSAAVKERLRGKTPEGLGGAAKSENSLTDPFARAFSGAFKK